MRETKAGKLRKILMTLTLVLAMVPLFAMAVYASEPLDDDSVTIEGMEYSDGTYDGYTVSTVDGVKTWKLTKNIVTTEAIPGNGVLDLNGYGVRMTADDEILIYVSGSFTLKDSDPTKVHYITVDENGRGIQVKNTGTESDTCFKVTGGYLTGSVADDVDAYWVAAVTVTKEGSGAGDRMTMEGGTIIGNGKMSADHGGGVYINGAYSRFIMNGGTICHNLAKSGGAVHMGGGSFIMNGRMICHSVKIGQIIKNWKEG